MPTKAMPRRRKQKKLLKRSALPASELERMIMAPLRKFKTLKGIAFIYVGSYGTEPNWFARTIPSVVPNACRKKFVTAFAAVRKEFDLIPLDANGSMENMDWCVAETYLASQPSGQFAKAIPITPNKKPRLMAEPGLQGSLIPRGSVGADPNQPANQKHIPLTQT
jgi:hypothetical protein